MKKSGLFRFFFIAIVGFILVLFANYLFLNFDKTLYETETAYISTVTNSFLGQTFVLRKESLIESSKEKVVNYFVEDGEKVATGAHIANFYGNIDDLKELYEYSNIQDEIVLLYEVMLLKGSKNVAPDVLCSQITNSFGTMLDIFDSKNFKNFKQQKYDLFISLIKRNLIYGQVSGISEKISELEKKSSVYLNNKYNIDEVYSSATGYFSKNVDGYEDVFLSDDFLDCDYDYYSNLMKTQKKDLDSEKYIGKIITDFDWYILVKTDKKNVEKLGSAGSVELNYNIPDFETISATILDIKEDANQEDAIIILKSSYMSRDIVKLRREKAVISTRSYYGLIVDIDAIRFVDDQRGVFVRDNKEIKFKKVDPLFETDKIMISQIRPFEQDFLQIFDEVILKGQGIYDGKIID